MYRLTHPVYLRFGFAAAMILIFSVGCGKSTDSPAPSAPLPSEPSPSESVNGSVASPSATGTAPLDSQPANSQPSVQTEPPGKLEMPAGAIPPTEEEVPPAKGTGGFEMPKDTDATQSKMDDAKQTIQYAAWPEIQSHLTSTGKLTVVDFWSLACQPCLEEFPGLVRMHQELKEKVHCVSVDVDFDGRKTRPPEYYEPRVVTFLAQVGATFPTFISTTASDEIFQALNLDSIPAVLIYDAEGKLLKRFVDVGETAGFSYDKDVIPFVKQLAG